MEDEWLSENDRKHYEITRDFINRRRLGLIPPRKTKEASYMGTHQLPKGKCPKCEKKSYLTTDHKGNKMCSRCYRALV